MSDVLTEDEASALSARLYAALKHEKGCSCGKCSGGLNAVDALARSHEQLRGERDAAWQNLTEARARATNRGQDADNLERRLAALQERFDHLHSEWGYGHARGDHLVYEAEWEAFDQWQRSAAVRAGGEAAAALEKIAEQQPVVLAYIEANGFVFDDIGREPGNWQHLAFSIYTDLCEVDSIARAALYELAAGGGAVQAGDAA